MCETTDASTAPTAATVAAPQGGAGEPAATAAPPSTTASVPAMIVSRGPTRRLWRRRAKRGSTIGVSSHIAIGVWLADDPVDEAADRAARERADDVDPEMAEGAVDQRRRDRARGVERAAGDRAAHGRRGEDEEADREGGEDPVPRRAAVGR